MGSTGYQMLLQAIHTLTSDILWGNDSMWVLFIKTYFHASSCISGSMWEYETMNASMWMYISPCSQRWLLCLRVNNWTSSVKIMTVHLTSFNWYVSKSDNVLFYIGRTYKCLNRGQLFSPIWWLPSCHVIQNKLCIIVAIIYIHIIIWYICCTTLLNPCLRCHSLNAPLSSRSQEELQAVLHVLDQTQLSLGTKRKIA